MQNLDRSRQVLAINLACMAGFIDATGFLSGAGYFVSFMSGNTTRLAVNLARDPAQTLIPALLISGFVAGVIGGSLLTYAAGSRRKPAVLALVTALLLGAAISGNLGAERLALAGMVMAMGALNNVFQRGGEVAVGVTYMTGALVRAGQGLAAHIAGRGGSGWAGHLLLWLGLASGAIAGALAWQRFGPVIEWLACLWCAVLTVLASRLPTEISR